MQKLSRSKVVGSKLFSFAKVAVLAASISGCGAKTGLNKPEPVDASVEVRDSATDRPTIRADVVTRDTATGDVITTPDVATDAPDSGVCPSVCELVNSAHLSDYSTLCSSGVMTDHYVGPPVTCHSILTPGFGPIALSIDGIEPHGEDDTLIFSKYTTGCAPLGRDQVSFNQELSITYSVSSGTYSFSMLPTRPTMLMYPDSGAQEALVQLWASGCGAPLEVPPTPSCSGRNYQSITFPLAELDGNNELKVGNYTIRVIEINETVMATTDPSATTCPISDKHVRFEIGPTVGGRYVYTFNEGESDWRDMGSSCFFVGVRSINMLVGAPSSPGPGIQPTCTVSREYAVFTIQLPTN